MGKFYFRALQTQTPGCEWLRQQALADRGNAHHLLSFLFKAFVKSALSPHLKVPDNRTERLIWQILAEAFPVPLFAEAGFRGQAHKVWNKIKLRRPHSLRFWASLKAWSSAICSVELRLGFLNNTVVLNLLLAIVYTWQSVRTDHMRINTLPFSPSELRSTPQ